MSVKRMFTLVITLVMAVSLAACAKTEKPSSTAAPTEVKGTVYDTGNFSAIVPDGWKAFTVADMWSEEEDAVDPNKIQIAKGAVEDYELYSKPSIEISYYDADTEMTVPSKEWYENAKDIESREIGGRTWSGYTATSLDTPMVVLWTGENGSDQFQVTIWTDMGDGTISIDDADVQAVIASIKASK